MTSSDREMTMQLQSRIYIYSESGGFSVLSPAALLCVARQEWHFGVPRGGGSSWPTVPHRFSVYQGPLKIRAR